MRFFRAVRWRTRWRRKRARSRSARTSGVGSQIFGHEVPTGELGEDPGVDLVGLGREGCQPLDLDRITDGDVPAAELELVVDEPGSRHRLDGRRSPPGRAGGRGPRASGARRASGRTAVTSTVRPSSSSTCTSSLWRDRSKPGVQHLLGLLVLVATTTQRCHQRGPLSWHSIVVTTETWRPVGDDTIESMLRFSRATTTMTQGARTSDDFHILVHGRRALQTPPAWSMSGPPSNEPP